jgi:hypothetical protein
MVLVSESICLSILRYVNAMEVTAEVDLPVAQGQKINQAMKDMQIKAEQDNLMNQGNISHSINPGAWQGMLQEMVTGTDQVWDDII